MSARVTFSPREASAASFSFVRIIAEISGGENSLPEALTRTSPFCAATTVKGTIFISSGTSENLRPMKRLIEKTVLVGLVIACRLATCPTRRSPVLENATTEGVVRFPSALGMTMGSPPSMTATHEDGGVRAIPAGVGEADGAAALHDGHARIRGAEVDSDDLAHCSPLSR